MSTCYVELDANDGNEGSLICRLQGLLVMHVKYALETVIEIQHEDRRARKDLMGLQFHLAESNNGGSWDRSVQPGGTLD